MGSGAGKRGGGWVLASNPKRPATFNKRIRWWTTSGAPRTFLHDLQRLKTIKNGWKIGPRRCRPGCQCWQFVGWTLWSSSCSRSFNPNRIDWVDWIHLKQTTGWLIIVILIWNRPRNRVDILRNGRRVLASFLSLMFIIVVIWIIFMIVFEVMLNASCLHSSTAPCVKLIMNSNRMISRF